MEEEKKLIFKELEKKDFTHADAVRAVRVWNVIHTEQGGYTEDDFTFHLFPDGEITISSNDSDGFISMRPEIANVLKTVLLNSKNYAD